MTNAMLTILQVNDLHGYIEPHPEVFRTEGAFGYRTCGGLARIKSVFNQARAENPGGVVALDNGDTFHGTYVAVRSQGEALVPLMNGLGFDAMTAHWEFAYGPEQFLKLSAKLDYPVLAINCYDVAQGRLVFTPTRVIERAGLRIGIIGIAATIVDKGMPPSYSAGLRFSLGDEELPGHIERLRASDRVDLVIVLSHLGFPQDAKLARMVPGVDVIVSGHTHNRLYRPVRVGETLIIQSGCHGSFVGRLDLSVRGGRISDAHHRLVEVDESIPANSDLEAMVGDTMAPHRPYLDEVVGRTVQPLDRATYLEASMDDVLLDAITATAGTGIAFSNGWRYGAPVLPGPVRREHLWNMVPTDAQVSTVELTGDEVRDMLEANLERTYAADPYRQMGGFVKRCHGMNLFFKMENPNGQRIEDLLIAGAPVVGDRTYHVAMLGEQGVPRKYGVHRTDLGVSAVQALERYFGSDLPRRHAGNRGSVVAI